MAHFEYCPNCRHVVEVKPPDVRSPPGAGTIAMVALTLGLLVVNLALTIYVFRYVNGVVSLFQ